MSSDLPCPHHLSQVILTLVICIWRGEILYLIDLTFCPMYYIIYHGLSHLLSYNCTTRIWIHHSTVIVREKIGGSLCNFVIVGIKYNVWPQLKKNCWLKSKWNNGPRTFVGKSCVVIEDYICIGTILRLTVIIPQIHRMTG